MSQPNRRTKIMWAIEHVPSGSWDRGDTNMVLYPFDYEARVACANSAFRPIRVEVKVAPKEED